MGNSNSSTASTGNLPPLDTVTSCKTEKLMGTWLVIAVKPTMFETTSSNGVERYSRPQGKSHDIDISFTYNQNEPIESPFKSISQKAWVQGLNKEDSGEWKVSPVWPLKLPYLILEVDQAAYSYVIVGYPQRRYCWIMYRKPQMPESTYEMLTKLVTEKHKYNLDDFRLVPQKWTAEEREKRGLTKDEIPDDMLSSSS